MPDVKQPEPRDEQEEQPERGSKRSLLDRTVDLTRLDPQMIVFAALLLVAALLRFWDLGAQAMHHDEAVHAWTSWRFYTGEELYQYDPTFHGPFLYHITALFYFLFGVSDAAARAPQALFGVLLVALCLPLRRWLGRWGWLFAAGLLAFSPAFVYFSRFARHDAFVAVWTLGLAVALFRYLEERRPRDLVLAAAALALSFATKELTFITTFIFLSFFGLAYLHDHLQARFRPTGRIVAGVVLILMLIGQLILAGGGPPLPRAILMALTLLAAGYLGLSLLWPRTFREGPSPVTSAVSTLLREPRVLLAGLGVFGLLFGLLFTTLLTHPRGFLDGIVRGLEYWTQQQEVRRGGQPWFYYLILLPVYEPIALTAGLAGFGLALAKGRRREPQAEAPPGSDPSSNARLFAFFLAFWAVFALVLYSWAGEKMPWLLLHIALPLVLLASLALEAFRRWLVRHEFWRSKSWFVGPLILLLTFVVRGLRAVTSEQIPQDLARQYQNLQKGVLAAVFLGLASLLLWRIVTSQGRHVGQSLAATGLLVLSLYTVRSTLLLNFYHSDTPVEMLVYTQTAPDVPLVVQQIERLAVDQTRTQRTVQDPTGGHGLKIAIDTTNALQWPFNWYLRDFSRAGSLTLFDGTRSAPPETDVVLVLAQNDSTLSPYLSDDYTGVRYKHRWWFPEFETYKRWTLLDDKGAAETGLPKMPWLKWETYSTDGWVHLWQYITARSLPYVLGSQDFVLYIRTDLLPAGGVAPEPDPYLENLAPRTAATFLGSAGSGPGELNFPRGIALDAAGNLYVADSGNHRVVRFDASGESSSWGGFCDLSGETLSDECLDPDGDGPLPAAPGRFNSPWGIAVDAQGRVYVADTWNHRIQVFDAEGTFLGHWGTATLVDVETNPGGRQGNLYSFYGPRGIAVDEAGRAYVTDTGNERVLVYEITEDESGQIQAEFLYQWGMMGPAPGEFLEPVGIAVDLTGRVYVADTWNQRIQVFAPGLDGVISPEPAVTWEVTGWENTSVDNKPFLAVGPGSQVFFTVPERHFVAATDASGDILAVWGQYGTDLASFNLPTGVAVDAQGRVYVSDAGNGRVLVFTVP